MLTLHHKGLTKHHAEWVKTYDWIIQMNCLASLPVAPPLILDTFYFYYTTSHIAYFTLHNNYLTALVANCFADLDHYKTRFCFTCQPLENRFQKYISKTKR